MATTIEIPLELDLADPTNANAYWTRQDMGAGYQGVYRFNGSGDIFPASKMVFKGNIPKNLASPTNWNLVLHHANQAGAGAVLVRVEGNVLGSGDTPDARTVLVPNQVVGVGVSGDVNITPLSATSFDALLALGAGKSLRIEFDRIPNRASGDSIVNYWDLTLPPLLRVDVV